MKKEFLVAHVLKDEAGNWLNPHSLAEHLVAVSDKAERAAGDFGSDWSRLAGMFHDFGKFRSAFQKYIREASGYDAENASIESITYTNKNHSMAGAKYLEGELKEVLGPFVKVFGYLIAGHHAGLPDWSSENGGQASLSYRLNNCQEEYEDALKGFKGGEQYELLDELNRFKDNLHPPLAEHVEEFHIWIRMLFSALVDADFLDTESYMNSEISKQRRSTTDQILSEIKENFFEKIDEMLGGAQPTALNQTRKSILDDCLSAAEIERSLFSLTVPTGGGKTLSSMAFALKHAEKFNKRRVIYAIPFTSIIEQNAAVFRDFIGDEYVLEHHSNFDPKDQSETARTRLASENWDVPVIVTTNVQLFESLFAAKTSQCRKLHNIVNSVIVLDEAQQIPRDFQKPITHMMQVLSEKYGVTWVLCTATQPDLSKVQDPFGNLMMQGLEGVHEIISKPDELSQQLKRVEVHLPSPNDPRKSWKEVTEELKNHDCVLAIVNTRKDAQELFECLDGEPNTYHLSAQMCPKHRSQVLAEIKERLQQKHAGKEGVLRVISTQLIEAGVDVDFPVVYRAMAGLDSIAQSAGRCNREDKMDSFGQVHVFYPDKKAPVGFLRQGADATEELIASGHLQAPLSPSNFTRYFQLLNANKDRDRHRVMEFLTTNKELHIDFRTAAEKFRLIDNKGVSIVVPFKPEAAKESPIYQWLSILENDPSKRWVYRKLQGFSVTVPERVADLLQAEGSLQSVAGQWVLLEARYDAKLGLQPAGKLLSQDSYYL
jgi:CRISPR-associated endonuclease/helicase Cas3